MGQRFFPFQKVSYFENQEIRSKGWGKGPGLNSGVLPSPDFSLEEENESYPNQNNEADLERKIIKNGFLSLLVTDVDRTAEDISQLAEKLDGFVLSSYLYETDQKTKRGEISIKVPAERFEEAIEKIKGLAVRVENERTTVTDVTEEYVDLEAQLRNLRREEEQYLKIMEKAETVEEILKVSQYLSNVRGRIERIEGRLKYLSQQIEMSVLRISLVAEKDVEVFGIYWRPLSVVKQAFHKMLEDFTRFIDAIIRFVFFLPVLALWSITIILGLYGGIKTLLVLKRKLFPHKKK